MSWSNGFGRTLLFAALCAGAAPLYLGLARVVMGDDAALASWLLLCAALYLLGIARRPAYGLAAALATLACGSALAIFGANVGQVALAAGVLTGVFRSGLLYRDRHGARFARPFLAEAGLIGGGLALASYLLGGALLPEAFATWGFFLVQSGFFLIGGEAARTPNPGTAEPDPFDRALERARALLERN